MKAGTLGLYALFGGGSLIAGVAALLAPGIVLGDATTPLTAHLVREEAAAFVFIGLMFLWCIRHFEQRRPVHLALLIFVSLFAAIHWADYLRQPQSVWGAVTNTVPVCLLAITAPFRAPR